MIEAGEQPRLAQQLAEVDALLVRNLERDLLVDPGVFREVDRAEAAAADRRQDLVLADDLAAEEHLRASIAKRPAAPRAADRGALAIITAPVHRFFAPDARPRRRDRGAAARRSGASQRSVLRLGRRRVRCRCVRRPWTRVPRAGGERRTPRRSRADLSRASSRRPSRRWPLTLVAGGAEGRQDGRHRPRRGDARRRRDSADRHQAHRDRRSPTLLKSGSGRAVAARGAGVGQAVPPRGAARHPLPLTLETYLGDPPAALRLDAGRAVGLGT